MKTWDEKLEDLPNLTLRLTIVTIIESPEIGSHLFSQLIFNEKQYNGEKKQLVLEQVNCHVGKKMNLDPYITSHTKDII